MSYPGSISGDSLGQFYQFLGLSKWTSHHPPAATLLQGIFLSVGDWISGNVGLLIYGIIQSLIFAYILTRMFELFHILQTPKILYIITWIIVFSCPYFTGYVPFVVKDTLYAYAFLLFEIELVYFIIQGEDALQKKHLFIYCVAGTLTILLRNNGKYALYPVIILLVIYVFIKFKNQLKDKLITVFFKSRILQFAGL